jgi:phycocyanobilin:ferredoxin oxidoreductase
MTNFHPLVQTLASNLRVSASSLPKVKPLSNHLLDKQATVNAVVDDENLIIHNEFFKCPGLRKIHIETAKLGNLDILHSVFFPNPKYDLPIFGADIVATPAGVGAAIVDLSPVNGLSDTITSKLSKLSGKYTFKEVRALPLWGEDIFSPYCKFVRLKNKKEEDNFVSMVQDYLDIFCHEVIERSKDNTDSSESGSWIPIMKRFDGQLWYCKQQRKNDKTRGILAKCFDEQWADDYLNNILFDDPKTPPSHGMN